MKFKITDDHIKLLRRAYFQWQDDEYGAPEIDPKRPYGNSYVIGDIAEILEIEPELETRGQSNFSPRQIKHMEGLHHDLLTVIRIMLQKATFFTGVYELDDKVWRMVEDRYGPV